MPDELLVGGLYSILTNSGKYKIAKILELDEGGIHLRVFENSFDERPRKVDFKTLTLGKFGGEEFSAGHIPVLDEVFTRAAPSFISKSTVSKDELEGYYIWRDSNGGYWNVDL